MRFLVLLFSPAIIAVAAVAAAMAWFGDRILGSIERLLSRAGL